MALSVAFVLLSVALPFIHAAPSASSCTGTISSMSDVSSAVKCTTVNINSFTVPAGETFELDLAEGTTVNMSKRLVFWGRNAYDSVELTPNHRCPVGDVTFGTQNWDGPLFQVRYDIPMVIYNKLVHLKMQFPLAVKTLHVRPEWNLS